MGLGAVKARWLCALLAAVSAVSALAEVTVYKKLGDEVVLTPEPVPDAISSITWLEGRHLAMDWDKSDPNVNLYRHFQARGSLNTSSAAMTITQLTRDDSNKYTVEVNGHVVAAFDLRVISAVAVPSVTLSCNDEKTRCLLVCHSNLTDAEPVTYTWRSDNGSAISSGRQLEITKDHSTIAQFICELQNPVSSQRSLPVPSPLVPNGAPSEASHQPNVKTGVTVLICLLVSLLLLVFIHRVKAGMWFFEKESMPWERDFWRKSTSEGRAEACENQAEEQQLTNNSSSAPVEGQSRSEMC